MDSLYIDQLKNKYNNDFVLSKSTNKVLNYENIPLFNFSEYLSTSELHNHLIGFRNVHNTTHTPNIEIDGRKQFKEDMYMIYSNNNFSVYKLYIENISNERYLKVCWYADGNLYENKIKLL